jgi:hypothetical protein
LIGLGQPFPFTRIPSSSLKNGKLIKIILKIKLHIMPYLLTAWSRVLLKKLIGSQLAKKLPAFYKTQRFITTFMIQTLNRRLGEPQGRSKCDGKE